MTRGAATITRCPAKQGDLGAISQSLFRYRNDVLRSHLTGVREGLKNAGKGNGDFKVIVFSHTHAADPGVNPFGSTAPWQPTVVNTGSWQRVATPGQLRKSWCAKGSSDADILKRCRPEDLPPCYAVVIVPAYASEPEPLLCYWTKNEERRWVLSESCVTD